MAFSARSHVVHRCLTLCPLTLVVLGGANVVGMEGTSLSRLVVRSRGLVVLAAPYFVVNCMRGGPTVKATRIFRNSIDNIAQLFLFRMHECKSWTHDRTGLTRNLDCAFCVKLQPTTLVFDGWPLCLKLRRTVAISSSFGGESKEPTVPVSQFTCSSLSVIVTLVTRCEQRVNIITNVNDYYY